jgi:hypothetical protein
LIREALGDPSVTRADLRLSTDASGRLFATTKQDGFIREIVPLPRADVLHLYAPTAELSAGVNTCFQLLDHLGGPSSIVAITSISGSISDRCNHLGSVPSGSDFELQSGAAYIVELAGVVEFDVGGAADCPASELVTGVNLLGVAHARLGLSCFDLLTEFGEDVVSVAETLDRRSDTFVACAWQDGQPSGRDFPIRVGEGYLVHSRTNAVANLNEPTLAVCL